NEIDNEIDDEIEEDNDFQSAVALDGDSIEDIITEESSNFLNNAEENSAVENEQSFSETGEEALLVEEVEDEDSLIDADFTNLEDENIEILSEADSHLDSDVPFSSDSSNEDDDAEKNSEILKKINDENYNEFTANNELKNFKPIISKQVDYLEILNAASKETATLEIDSDSYDNFLSIISEKFGFSKSALLIFSPPVKKFVFLSGQNIDEQSKQKLSFDLEFNNIYKTLAKEKSYLILPEHNNFDIINDLLSDNDKSDSEFQLYAPFIFSARIIGVFLGFKMISDNIPDSECIKSLAIFGRFNGPLLYNLFQHNSLKSNKSASINSAIDDFEKDNDNISPNETEFEEISDDENNQINLDISNSIDNFSDTQTLELEENSEDNVELYTPDIETTLPEDPQILDEEDSGDVDDIDSLIDPKYQKLLYFLEEKISKDLVNTISMIKLSFSNLDDLKDAHPNFDLPSFRNEAQFLVINSIDPDGYVNVFDNLDIISILPNTNKEEAIEKSESIIEGIKNIFLEAVGSKDIEISFKTASYPNDAENALTLLLNLIND
ncbi:MAG TPA: hypothetical protein PLI57_05115, partial [Spirochaetota bacterium]|nr:hypothetical protein [Spirochaetota bacterium]